jgi:hypothetical protein
MATALAGVFTTSSVSLYKGSSCSGTPATQVLDSCTRLSSDLSVYGILTCASSNSDYTLKACLSSDCSSSCTGATGRNGDCTSLPLNAGSVNVTCGVLTPLSIGLIVVASLILLCCIAYLLDRLIWCCIDATIGACLRCCRQRQVEEAQALLAASSARARELRIANVMARADAYAIKRDIEKLEGELKYARLEAELREARLAQARGGAAAAAGAEEDGAYGALPNQPMHWEHPRN